MYATNNYICFKIICKAKINSKTFLLIFFIFNYHTENFMNFLKENSSNFIYRAPFAVWPSPDQVRAAGYALSGGLHVPRETGREWFSRSDGSANGGIDVIN